MNSQTSVAVNFPVLPAARIFCGKSLPRNMIWRPAKAVTGAARTCSSNENEHFGLADSFRRKKRLLLL